MAQTKQKAPSLLEVGSLVSTALRRSVVAPSITAYIPQEHQEPFHRSERNGRLFLGGNRAGKTVGGATEAVWWLTGTHPFKKTPKTPVRGRAIGVDFDDGINRIIKPEIARWIPASYLIDGDWEKSYSKGDKTLTLNNGSTLEFMSYDQDVQKFAGTSRHFVWFDEEPPEDIFNENMMRLVDVGGNWWMTMTPLIDMSWTYDRLYQKGISGGKILLPDGTEYEALEVFEVSSLQNKYVSAASLAIATEGLSDDERKAREQGKYFSYSGSIYGDSFTPKNVLKEPIHTSDSWSIFHSKWGHFGMLDHGLTNPTAFYLGCYDQLGRVIIYYEYYHTKRLVKENAVAIKQAIEDLKLGPQLMYMVADPSIFSTDPITGTSIAQEYAENGLYFGKANNEVRGGINRVASRLKNGLLFITPNCEKAIWEFGRYRWAKFDTSKAAARHNLKEEPMKKDDHAMDAIRYGIVSRPQLDHEPALMTGNITNAPVALNHDFRVDEELIHKPVEDYYDPYLGTDW